MQREICSEEKIVYYWMTRAEKVNQDLQKSLQSEYVQWRTMKYRVCIFTSGTEDLLESTKELLLHNKNNNQNG